tara:strand:+ start:39 stop:788 length:750 start_codon:yes stop_codon:yes gene_type:complete
MAVTNGWGKGVENNTIDWGKGSTNNSNNWGSVYGSSAAGDTLLSASSFSNTNSLEFDGVDDELNFSSLSFSGAFTLSFWLKPAATNEYIIGTQSLTRNFVKLHSTTEIKIRMELTTNTFTESSNVMVLNQWQHLMFVKDASNNVSLFRNGAAFGSSATNSKTFIIDTISGLANNFYYEGKIDEFALWNSDQSSNISAIYNSGLPSDLSSLSPLTWWRFEEGSGTTATDSGSGGNNGTLVNGTYSTDVPT